MLYIKQFEIVKDAEETEFSQLLKDEHPDSKAPIAESSLSYANSLKHFLLAKAL